MAFACCAVSLVYAAVVAQGARWVRAVAAQRRCAAGCAPSSALRTSIGGSCAAAACR